MFDVIKHGAHWLIRELCARSRYSIYFQPSIKFCGLFYGEFVGDNQISPILQLNSLRSAGKESDQFDQSTWNVEVKGILLSDKYDDIIGDQ